MEILVRRATIDDADVIARNVVAMALDGSKVELSPTVVHEAVRNLFRKPELGFYIVAEFKGEIVGSLVIVYEWSDWRNGVYWWIHSVYVKSDLRRRGVYRQMYEYIRQEARSDDSVRGLNLSVNKLNTTARAAYERLGMKESNSVIYNTPEI